MENFEFKSAICTSREQSERLLSLGLKKETADCYLFEYDKEKYKVIAESWLDLTADKEYYSQYKDVCIPAWSIHRLIEILGPHRLPIHFRKKGRVDITTSHINQACSGRSGYNYYDSIIDCIAWLINEGYNHFNKDYLENEVK